MNSREEEVKKKQEQDGEDLEDQDQNRGEDDDAEDRFDITQMKSDYDDILDPIKDRSLFTKFTWEDDGQERQLEADFLNKTAGKLWLVEKDGERSLAISDRKGKFDHLITF